MLFLKMAHNVPIAATLLQLHTQNQQITTIKIIIMTEEKTLDRIRNAMTNLSQALEGKYTIDEYDLEEINILLAVFQRLYTSSRENLKPHRCPICEGVGLVSGSFYNSLPGCGGTTADVVQSCRQCNGSGIIWG